MISTIDLLDGVEAGGGGGGGVVEDPEPGDEANERGEDEVSGNEGEGRKRGKGIRGRGGITLSGT